MKKSKISTRLLSIFLSVVMLVTMLSVGFVVPEAKSATVGQTINANSITKINEAINAANSAGPNVITTIKLSADVSNSGALGKFNTITGNVVLDLFGRNVLLSYEKVGEYGSPQTDVQIPNENAGVTHESTDAHCLTNAMFNVAEGASLQIINSSAVDSVMQVYTKFEDTKGDDTLQYHQTSSALIYSKGTLVIGDKDTSENNNFSLKTISTCRNTGTSTFAGAYKGSIANSITVSVDGENAVFKMYGGIIDSTAQSRARNDRKNYLFCYGLNINNCKSAEVYGGSIGISSVGDTKTEVQQQKSNDSKATEAYAAAIRSNSPYLYIFDVQSLVRTRTASDTNKNGVLFSSNVYSTTDANAAHVYGGSFQVIAERSGSDGSKNNAYFFMNGYKTIQNGIINPSTVAGSNYGVQSPEDGKTANISSTVYSLMVNGGDLSENGINPFAYDTFRQYLGAYVNANVDKYYGSGVNKTIIDGTENLSCSTKEYLRNGYTHSAWQGTTHPGLQYSTSYTTTNAAGVNSNGGTLFISPVWTENTYSISYNYNDNEGNMRVTNKSSMPTSYKITDTKYLGLPTRLGWTFNNWELTNVTYPDTDTVNPWTRGNIYPAGFALNGRNGNLTLKANWTINTYTATINLGGGQKNNSSNDITYQYTVNTGFSFPTELTKDYYTFNGNYKVTTPDGSWNADNTLYSAGASSPADSYGNVTLTAQYTPVTYAISYDSQNGSAVESETYNFETQRSLPISERLGYTFAGWRVKSTDAGSSWVVGQVYTAIPSGSHGNVSFEAVWESVQSTVSISLEANETYIGLLQNPYRYESNLVLENQPTKTGYNFTGWKVKSVSGAGATWTVGTVYTPDPATGIVTLPANMLGDCVIIPQWQTKTYTITFNTNGAGSLEAFQYTIEDTVILPTVSKTGYTFTGWTVSRGAHNWNNAVYNSGAPGYGSMYGDIVLVAGWSTNAYSITFLEDGGTIVGTRPTGFNIESPVALPTVEKNGYTFGGWKVHSYAVNSSWTLNQELGQTLPEGNYGDVTLTPKWTPTVYRIDYAGTAASMPMDKDYTITESFYLPAASDHGQEFGGWEVINCLDGNWGNAGTVYSTDVLLSNKYGNVTLRPIFTPRTYTIIYQKDSTTLYSDTYTIAQAFDLRPFSENGYNFNGWVVAQVNGGAGWSVGSTLQPGNYGAGAFYGDVVLSASVTPIDYNIKFISNGGTPFADLTYNITSTDTLPVPEKQGYNFDGWRVTSPAGAWLENQRYSGGAPISGKYGSVILTAEWSPKQYQITWVTGNGTHITDGYYDSMPSYDNVDTSKPADAQYTYTFTGWSPELMIVNGNATYTAQYSRTLRDYTITWKYETDESGVYTTQTAVYTYGEHPIFNNGINPIKDSVNPDDHVFRFVGWYDDANNQLTADTTVTGAKTYTARFVRVEAPRKVTWVIGETRQETLWEVGETPYYVGVPVVPDENGYKFVFSSWTPSIVPVQQDTDYEYVAQFTQQPQTYEASFVLNGGQYSGNTSVSYNRVSGLNMPIPTKAGYSFVGWQVELPQGNWAADLYTLNTYIGKYGNVTFKAVWAATEYTISIDTDPDIITHTYTIESTDTLPAITKDGFVLSAWTVVSAQGNWVAGDTLSVDKLLTGMYGNVTIAPLWTERLYTITWICDDVVQTAEFAFGSQVLAYPPISKAGYTATWDMEIPATMPAEDLTFHAVYTPIQYYIRFNTAGGSEVENFYYDITSTQVLPSPTRQGATFMGWRVSAGGGTWVRNSTVSGGTVLTGKYGNTTLTAIWEIDIHTVTWNAGDMVKVTRWYHGTMPSFDGTPYKSPDANNSYEFTGWDKEFVPVTEDVTYTALFNTIERLYNVSWIIDGYTVTQQYRYGETPVYLGETPERPSTVEFDFEFSGWSPEISSVTGDVEYIAQFDVYTKLLSIRVSNPVLSSQVGDEIVLTAILNPITATSRDVVWTSMNEDIATVDSLGKVSAIKSGIAVIKLESKDKQFKAYSVINIAPVVDKFITISAGGLSTTRLPGEAIQLTASVMPENATFKNVVWSSADPTIATVDSNGLVVFGNVYGTTVITATANGYATGRIEVSTVEASSVEPDEVPTYIITFAQGTSNYIIGGNAYKSISVVCEEGDTIEFLLEKPHFATLNGYQMRREADGVFRIRDIDQNYYIIAVERADIGIPEEDNPPEQELTFFERLQAFFRKIVEFFRNLFR